VQAFHEVVSRLENESRLQESGEKSSAASPMQTNAASKVTASKEKVADMEMLLEPAGDHQRPNKKRKHKKKHKSKKHKKKQQSSSSSSSSSSSDNSDSDSDSASSDIEEGAKKKTERR
jgi:protein required for attachment to host cells